jgi:hypothetical protein
MHLHTNTGCISAFLNIYRKAFVPAIKPFVITCPQKGIFLQIPFKNLTLSCMFSFLKRFLYVVPHGILQVFIIILYENVFQKWVIFSKVTRV